MLGGIRRWVDEWRPSVVTLGAPVYPLIVLFGLNAVDELDRAAFAVLLPDIRDHFDLSDAGALRLVSLTTIAVLLIEVPLSFYCDRGNRVRIATTGAAVWALFAFGTGGAVVVGSLGMLIAMRIGAGTGRAVVTPTHSSLLSDYYEPKARVKVFSAHRQANSVGQVLGPLFGGVVAAALGLEWPFFLFAIPTLIFVFLSMRLREPVRGYHERKAAGLDEEAALVADAHEGVRGTFKVLYQVRTIRRIWCAVPFVGVTLFGVIQLINLVYEDVFDLDSAARGAIAAGVEPLQVVGVFVAMPRVAKIAFTDPGFLLRFVAIVGVVDGLLIAMLAYAPHVSIAIAMHALLAASIGTLAPAFFALISIVAPARVRAASFSTISVFAIPGIAVFLPLIGQVSDRLGIQASIVTLVPIAVIAGFILRSAAPFVMDDILTANAPPPTEGDLVEELAEADTFDAPHG
jgi:branched-chain amino acid transport system ATP-binding protein